MRFTDTLLEHLPHGTGERLERHAPVLLDLLLVTLLLGWGITNWPMGGAGLPFWASTPDQYLYGPDAAAWATNALAFYDGRYGDLDYHRMPAFTILTWLPLAMGYGVALAGHLLNHSFQLLLPVILYALGRESGSRGAGLGAGLMAALNLYLLNSSRTSGVDPTIATLIPLMLLTAMGTARNWWFAPLSGGVAALVTCAHYTTLPYIVPSIILVFIAGRPGWRRFLGTVLHAAAAFGLLYLIFQVFQFPDKNQLALTVQEGAQAGSSRGVADSNWTHMRTLIETNGRDGINDCIRLMVGYLRPAWVPWSLALALPWIGAAGVMLEGWIPPETKRSWFRFVNWKIGLAMVLCLGPLPFLAIAKAPERYSYNLLPVVLLLMWRGVASILAVVDGILRKLWGRWPSGALCIVLALGVGMKVRSDLGDRLRPMPSPADAVVAQAVGSALAELVPSGGGVAVPMREVAVYAGRSYCPTSNCPFGAEEIDMRRCIVLMDKECGGEGPLPYVVIGYPSGQEARSTLRQAMDAWVLSHWTSAKHVSTFGYTADIVLIPREEAKAMLKPGTAIPIPPMQ